MPIRDRMLAVLVAVIWGLNFVVIDEGMSNIPPLLFLAIRFVFVAFPLILFINRPSIRWRTIAGIGIFTSLGQFGLLYIALSLGMPAGLAALVLQAQVVFTVAIAWIVLGERGTRRQLIGVAIGCLGLIWVGGAHGMNAPILPLVVTIGAALSWAIGNILTRGAKVNSGLSVVVWSAVVVPIPCVALSLIFDGPETVGDALTQIGVGSVGSTAYTVIGASIIGYGVFNGLLSRHNAASVVPYILLVPPIGIVSAWIIQGEVPSAAELVGAAVLLIGVSIAVSSGRRTPQTPTRTSPR